ncbi:MAG: riboflavin synthase [Candidatus Eisenbacteria bacterium]|nr:riboflavin synthase [Candidatus Eisenbacteria bacterium]
MFTGIIEVIGSVSSIQRSAGGFSVTIEAPGVAQDTKAGESVSVNGACLTVASLMSERAFSVEVVAETLEKTNLVFLKSGDRVNLERSLKLGDRLSGHLVLGHVDGVGEVTGIRQTGAGKTMNIEIPSELVRYFALKGSMALDGVSLTISGLSGRSVEVSLIPFTLKSTIVGSYTSGRKVNVEVDVIARYLESLLVDNGGRRGRSFEKGLTLDFLKEKWL